MGTSRKIKTETRKRTDKANKTNDRRAGKADGYIGGLEYTLEQRREMIVERGINPDTGELYNSISEHRKALTPYWGSITSGEMAHITHEIWRDIDPSPEGVRTGAIAVHPPGKKLALV